MFATILTVKSNNLNKEYQGAFYLLADLTPRELKEDRCSKGSRHGAPRCHDYAVTQGRCLYPHKVDFYCWSQYGQTSQSHRNLQLEMKQNLTSEELVFSDIFPDRDPRW